MTLKQKLSIGAAVTLSAASLAGCSSLRQDAWALTYELMVPGTESAELTNVSYSEQEKRGEDPQTTTLSSVTTGPLEGVADGTGWEADAMLEVGLTASITATAPEGVPATCRILLDGTREVASNTGEPGGSVTCEVVTPEFEK